VLYCTGSAVADFPVESVGEVVDGGQASRQFYKNCHSGPPIKTFEGRPAPESRDNIKRVYSTTMPAHAGKHREIRRIMYETYAS
jgi:hypothetical protein